MSLTVQSDIRRYAVENDGPPRPRDFYGRPDHLNNAAYVFKDVRGFKKYICEDHAIAYFKEQTAMQQELLFKLVFPK